MHGNGSGSNGYTQASRIYDESNTHTSTSARACTYTYIQRVHIDPAAPFYAFYRTDTTQHAPRTAPIIQGDFSCGLLRGAGCVAPFGRLRDIEPNCAGRAVYFARSRVMIITLKSGEMQTRDNDECGKPRAEFAMRNRARARSRARVVTSAQCVNRYCRLVYF